MSTGSFGAITIGVMPSWTRLFVYLVEDPWPIYFPIILGPDSLDTENLHKKTLDSGHLCIDLGMAEYKLCGERGIKIRDEGDLDKKHSIDTPIVFLSDMQVNRDE